MKPNILLIHGALGSATGFAALKAELEGRANVFASHLPGHGGHPYSGPFTSELFIHAVEEAIQQGFPGNDPVHVFGYSMGGYIALMASLAGNTRIASITTLATKMHWCPEVAENEEKLLNPDIIQTKLPAFATELEQRHAPADWKQVLHNTAGFMKQLGDTIPLNENTLGKLGIPCRFMVGDRDKMVGLEETISAFRATPGASLQVLPNTPHPLEKADTKLLASAILEMASAI